MYSFRYNGINIYICLYVYFSVYVLNFVCKYFAFVYSWINCIYFLCFDYHIGFFVCKCHRPEVMELVPQQPLFPGRCGHHTSLHREFHDGDAGGVLPLGGVRLHRHLIDDNNLLFIDLQDIQYA